MDRRSVTVARAEVEFGHIYCYLIDSPGIYTRESLKAYKSLEAYRYVISGHVQVVEYHSISEDSPYCAVRTKVTPSQRVSEKPHQPWVYLEKETATVFCGHCTCMAGLGEVCSHVAALLFKMEIGVKLGLTSLSATSELCKWNQAFRKQLEPTPVVEMQSLMKGSRVKTVPSVIPSGTDKLPDISVLESLRKVCPDAVFFTTIPKLDPEETDTASETGDHQRFLQPLRDLYKGEVNTEDIQVAWKNYKCSEEQAKDLELETRGQSVSATWYEQRKGRITGTKAHDVFIRKETTKPDNLIKLITGSKCYNLTASKAVKWGSSNEEKARDSYFLQERGKHLNLNVSSVGLLVDHRKPFLAVSADGLVSCQCCEKRVLEIKCPFKHKDKTVDQMLSDKDFCLDKTKKLKASHRYYTQVQLQMYVYELRLCHFFIFSNKDSACVVVQKDELFCKSLIAKCEAFFFKYVLGELVTRKLENGTNECDPEASQDEKDLELWCICQEPEYGRMIECSGSDCSMRWFHYECVNVRRCPRGKWYCPECSEK